MGLLFQMLSSPPSLQSPPLPLFITGFHTRVSVRHHGWACVQMDCGKWGGGDGRRKREKKEERKDGEKRGVKGRKGWRKGERGRIRWREGRG